jgi:polyhydroxyalkanoate synthesis regulator phasin
MTEEGKSDRKSASGGIKQGLGILSALKDAIEETIQDARDRGDLNPDRARDLVKKALGRAQDAAGDARSRLEELKERELPSVREAVEDLKRRVAKLEDEVGGAAGVDPPADGVSEKPEDREDTTPEP